MRAGKLGKIGRTFSLIDPSLLTIFQSFMKVLVRSFPAPMSHSLMWNSSITVLQARTPDTGAIFMIQSSFKIVRSRNIQRALTIILISQLTVLIHSLTHGRGLFLSIVVAGTAQIWVGFYMLVHFLKVCLSALLKYVHWAALRACPGRNPRQRAIARFLLVELPRWCTCQDWRLNERRGHRRLL